MNQPPVNFYLAPPPSGHSAVLVEDRWRGDLIPISSYGMQTLTSLRDRYLSSVEMIRDYLPDSEFSLRDRELHFQTDQRVFRLTQEYDPDLLFFRMDLRIRNLWHTVVSTTEPFLTTYFAVYFAFFDYTPLSFQETFYLDFPYYLSE